MVPALTGTIAAIPELFCSTEHLEGRKNREHDPQLHSPFSSPPQMQPDTAAELPAAGVR
jgi:hypothetical protein